MGAREIKELYRWWYFLVAVIVAGVIGVGYGGTASAYFVSDDFERIAEASRGSLSYFGTAWDGTTGRPAYYRPLIVQTYTLDYSFWGLNPRPYHLVNLLLHWGVSFLVALLTVELLGAAGGDRRKAFWVGGAAGLAFAASVRHTEAVTWVSGRADVAAALFALAALIVYVRFRPVKSRASHFAWLAAPFYALALLCKESAIAVPLIVLTLEIVLYHTLWDRKKPSTYLGYGLVLTMVGLLIAYLCLRYSITGALLSGKKTYLFAHADFFEYVKRALKFTVCVLAAPKRSQPFFGIRLPWDAVLYGYLLVGIIVSVILGFRRRGLPRPIRTIAGPVLAYAAAAIPVFYMSSSLYTTDSERFAYLPGVFALVFVVLLLYYLWRKGAAWILAGWALLNLPAVIVVNDGWSYAGDLSRTLLGEYTELADGSTLVLNLPDSVNDKYVLRRGFAEAVELTGAGPAPHGPVLRTVYPGEEAGKVEWRRTPDGYISNVEAPGWFHPFDGSEGRPLAIVERNENGYPTSVVFKAGTEYDSVLYESGGRLHRLE
ncbi:MAG: hypothetical protein JSW52_02235 [Candidatus Coatesbacteria bacterium]|nr:MAG: hypothetical protein JSW52_02235 [Candidatus Coatesbacteria bacterium]